MKLFNMIKNTTNVQPSYLNYHRYSDSKYDQNIFDSIPFHLQIHQLIHAYVKQNYPANRHCDILDLGAGTGLTSKVIQQLIPPPYSNFDIIDFSTNMLLGAKKKLGAKNVRYILADFSTKKFDKQYDMIVSVIGMHHQTHAGKKMMFKKIFASLKPGGVFLFGDLMTYKNKQIAALNHALHYHRLVKKHSDKKTLMEWTYHHMYLNDLAPIEDQIDWLKEAGFKIIFKFHKINTALLICKK
jgi:tRNA (cmo5U34)-methyltransferase